MQSDTGLAKTRNELFGFGYPVKFALCRHNDLLKKVCGGALWCTIHQSGGLLSTRTIPAAFSMPLSAPTLAH